MTEPARDTRGENPADRRPDGMPVGKPFEPGNRATRGRPRGLASATREVLKAAVHEGEDPAFALARFWAQVYADPNQKTEHRMQAADRLAERGWGKAPSFAPIEDDDPLGVREEGLDDAVGQFAAEVVRLAAVPDTGTTAPGDGKEGES